MTNYFPKLQLLLASNSPRRRELLGELCVDFRSITPPNISEIYPENLKNAEIVNYLAAQKAAALNAAQIAENQLILTADTIVCDEQKVLGKPANFAEAKEMLRSLSNKIHKVFTGVCLQNHRGKQLVFADESLVKFSALSEAEIDFYLEKFPPLDKAGAYGIQDWIGVAAIAEIQGSYQNVMGLPTQKLFATLKNLQQNGF